MQTELITHLDPKSPTSEAFKTLRTNIQFLSSNSDVRSILVTSPLPEDGKSWTATNLAVTFAQMGKKVIVVDADMRKGRQHTMFNIARYPGLSNFLLGIDKSGNPLSIQQDMVAHIKKTRIDNLFILPGGNKPANPSELIVSDKMGEVIDKLEELFDLVIFDGTPSILVADAIILSRKVDCTVIVTSYNKTKTRDLEKVVKDIQNVGSNIAGIVINKIPGNNKRYRNSYYY